MHRLAPYILAMQAVSLSLRFVKVEALSDELLHIITPVTSSPPSTSLSPEGKSTLGKALLWLPCHLKSKWFATKRFKRGLKENQEPRLNHRNHRQSRYVVTNLHNYG